MKTRILFLVWFLILILTLPAAAQVSATVSVSSHFRDFVGENAIDGKETTYWGSDPEQTLPQWIQLDFTQPAAFNRIELKFYRDLANFTYAVRDFRIEYWTGNDWTTLIGVVDNDQITPVFTFDPITTSALRVVFTKGMGSHNFVRLAELVVSQHTEKVNLALGATVQASSVYQHFQPPLAVDGDNTSQASRWLSQPSYPQWITLDFGRVCEVNEVHLYFFRNEAGYVYANTDYLIEYLDDNGQWQTAQVVIGNRLQDPKHEVGPLKTQQLRVTFQAGVTGADMVRLYEIEVY